MKKFFLIGAALLAIHATIYAQDSTCRKRDSVRAIILYVNSGQILLDTCIIVREERPEILIISEDGRLHHLMKPVCWILKDKPVKRDIILKTTVF